MSASSQRYRPVPLAGYETRMWGVLSHNDGRNVVRPNELGVAMRLLPSDICRQALLLSSQALSSNYALYSDMSRRVTETLGRFSPVGVRDHPPRTCQ